MQENKILLTNIRNLYENYKTLKDIYTTEYNNLYSYEIINNIFNDIFNLIIVAQKTIIIDYNTYINILNNIKTFTNILNTLIHINYISLIQINETIGNTYNYNDYIDIFSSINSSLNKSLFTIDENNNILDKIKNIDVLNNNYYIEHTIINTNNDTSGNIIDNNNIQTTLSIIFNTIDKILNLIESLTFLICITKKNVCEKNVFDYVKEKNICNNSDKCDNVNCDTKYNNDFSNFLKKKICIKSKSKSKKNYKKNNFSSSSSSSSSSTLSDINSCLNKNSSAINTSNNSIGNKYHKLIMLIKRNLILKYFIKVYCFVKNIFRSKKK